MPKFITALVLLCILCSGCLEEVAQNATGCTLTSFTLSPSADKSVAIGHTDYGGPSVAQPFVLSADGETISARALLKRTGSFAANTHTLIATIEGTGTHGPNNIPIATSQALDPVLISDSNAKSYSFTFPASVKLTAAQKYWLRIKASYSVNSKNFISWTGYEGKEGGYYNGSEPLGAMYEQNVPDTFASNLISSYRFLVFTIDCLKK
jgi:hypothetical protein